jgi:4-amino-4-deoxy-L-arabinose transferase-like glycosyltransferase
VNRHFWRHLPPKTDTASHGPTWRALLLLAIVVALASAALVAYRVEHFRFLDSPDAMRYASVAREFWRGNGFAWRQYWPSELAGAGYDPDKTSPQFLHPLIIAGLFSLLGERDLAVVVASMIPASISAGLLFLLARRWFDDRVAFVAAIVFALSEQALDYGTSGLTEPLFAVLLLGCLHLITLSEMGRPRLLWLCLAGATLGLSHAARPVGLYYVAAFVAYLLVVGRQRIRSVAGFLAGFALLVVLVAYVGTGSLLPVSDPAIGLLTGVGDFSGTYDVLRTVNTVNPLAYLLAHPAYYQAKLASSLTYYAANLPLAIAGGSFLVGALFLVSLFVRQRTPLLGRMRMLLLLLIGAQLTVNVLLWPTDRYFVPFVPLVAVFAVAFLWQIVDTMNAPTGTECEAA